MLFFSIVKRSVLMVVVFYYKYMLARKIETDCFSRNMPISNDPVVRISRNLAKK